MTATLPNVTAPNDAAEDTSNYQKHSSSNPLQRKLIDRFHHVLMAKLGQLAPTSFLDAGCGEVRFNVDHHLQPAVGMFVVGGGRESVTGQGGGSGTQDSSGVLIHESGSPAVFGRRSAPALPQCCSETCC